MAAPTGILAMLAKPKGKVGSEKSGPPEPGGEGYDGGGEVASSLREMFDALKSGDDEGAALAFKRAKVACEEEESEEDMSEMDMGDEPEEE